MVLANLVMTLVVQCTQMQLAAAHLLDRATVHQMLLEGGDPQLEVLAMPQLVEVFLELRLGACLLCLGRLLNLQLVAEEDLVVTKARKLLQAALTMSPFFAMVDAGMAKRAASIPEAEVVAA